MRVTHVPAGRNEDGELILRPLCCWCGLPVEDIPLQDCARRWWHMDCAGPYSPGLSDGPLVGGIPLEAWVNLRKGRQ